MRKEGVVLPFISFAIVDLFHYYDVVYMTLLSLRQGPVIPEAEPNEHPLVQVEGDAYASPGKFDALDAAWDPAFHDYAGHLFPVRLHRSQLKRLLESFKYRLGRHPRDLVSHVRCIFLARALADADATFEACKALFQVLAGKGQGLRAHVLRECAAVLGEARLQRLESLGQPGPSSAGDLLFPSHPIVICDAQPRAEGNDTLDALGEAHDFLENGQVAEARHCLENHLLQAPGDREAHTLLLEIYRRANDRAALDAMRSRLPDLPQEIADLWAAAAMTMAQPTAT